MTIDEALSGAVLANCSLDYYRALVASMLRAAVKHAEVCKRNDCGIASEIGMLWRERAAIESMTPHQWLKSCERAIEINAFLGFANAHERFKAWSRERAANAGRN